MFGWPNTYVFTKAMGEMLIGKLREDVPVVIIRPTIVTSTYREPFPGWSEGVRTIDSFIVAYAKGKLPCFLGNIETMFDVIPGDMVVNAVIVAMVGHANIHQSSSDIPFIYQLCSYSSSTYPLNCIKLRDYSYQYFSKNPLMDKDGKSHKIVMPLHFPTMASFRRYIYVNYMLPLEGLKFVNAAFCQCFRDTCKDVERKISHILRMVELNEPYIFFKGTFDELNTKRLRMAMRANETEANTFYFDPKCINWEDYFMNIHIPGLVKYVIKL
ncbi:Male sterility [Macleaya cordata]|uniref:Fatty acyl-CoA reductase n=1 Tax=Macleaya cordata TaxID=56857 RepID=A0A200QT82_MACCD|nr:Male sterility [Macleaya cordata]